METQTWHPRLTPYRFVVLLTTVGLGGVKAYAVSRKVVLVAVSVEWIASVVVFSMLSRMHVLFHGNS